MDGKRRLIFGFRVYALFDVLFSPKFELITWRKDGSKGPHTKFDKQEILKSNYKRKPKSL